MYSLAYEKRVFKDLDNIPKTEVEKITATASHLKQNPFPAGKYKKLSGSTGLYRIRQGDYRIIYTVDTAQKQINIILIRHRKESYRDL